MTRLSLLIVCMVSSVSICLSQNKLIAIKGGTLIQTQSGKTIPNSVVLVENNTILDVGPASKIKIPTDATVINATGKWLMPGMTDAHIHFFQSGGLYTRPDGLNLGKYYSYEKDQQWIKDNKDDQMRRYLTCGITTVIDVGGPFSNFEMRKYCNENENAPNALVTGPLVSTYMPSNLDKKDPPILKVNTEEEARELVRREVPYKPDFIKIWYIVFPGQTAEKTLPIIKATIDESHKNNLKVAVHATEYNTAKLAVQAGCDILVHSVDDQVLDKEFIQLLKSKNIVYIPTLIVASKYDEVFNQQHRLTPHDFRFANPFMLGTLFDLQDIPTRDIGFDYKKRRNTVKIPAKSDSVMLVNLKLLSDAGVNIASGTDAGNIGTMHASSFLVELQNMKLSGMTNEQILRASTIGAAIGFGKEKEMGSIEKGKIADILVLNKNPVEDLSNLDDIYLLVHRGKMIQTDTLIKRNPEALVQEALNGCNGHNLEAFLAPYSETAELYDFPDKFVSRGKDEMRKRFEPYFRSYPDLHCQSVNKIVNGNTVFDLEITSAAGMDRSVAVVIYEIENGKIQKVYFKGQ